jgi:hypothetical protein
MAFNPSSFSSFGALSGASNADRHAKALELAQGWSSNGIKAMQTSNDRTNAMAFSLGRDILGQQHQEEMMQQQMAFQREMADKQASAQKKKSGGLFGGLLSTAASFIPGAGPLISKGVDFAFSNFA